ncbi:PA14 domain-containing protein [uncultured Ferrovibrio sp.]|jgi:hypothetical protein|uniref:PA14 domain-containing protein n=1 Tax=uncultured Ferrovibrio sp. TaxID=1576913 RepID=UPI0026233942|nr:PA14 domain-containing protein [uncultured Ferrovibrio sp.]
MIARRSFIARSVIAGLLFAALTGLVPQVMAQGKPQPLSPQPASDSLKPGLLPRYYRNLLFNHIDELVRAAADPSQGEVGTPVPVLDESTAGKLWESRMDSLYGIRFDGLIKLERGEHYFVVNSNDGVRVFLGGPMLVEDPDVHADRMTTPAAVNVTQPGWYPLTIWYFQKRNTATLQLLWQPPGASQFTPVPAEVLAHQPK